MADELGKRWGYVGCKVAFAAKVVPWDQRASVIHFERPEDWSDEEWQEFVGWAMETFNPVATEGL